MNNKTFKYLIFVLLFFSLTGIKTQNSCPINFGPKHLEKAKLDLKNWNSKIVSCDVEVIQIEKGYIDKPYYKVKFKEGGEFWIGSLVTSGFEKIGAKLRLLGYFSLDAKDDLIANKFHKDGFHILAFAIINRETKKMAIVPDSENLVQEWINGNIPSSNK